MSCFALLLLAGMAAAAGTTGSSGMPSAGAADGTTTSQTTSVTTTSAQVTTTASPSAGSSATLGTLTLTRRSTAHADEPAAGSAPSTPAIALAVLAAALVLLSLAWALVRAFAYEPTWMPALRHSFAEAGFRTSATWAELWDWLRLGR